MRRDHKKYKTNDDVMNTPEFKLRINEISKNLSNINFSKIEHNMLISYVQDYVNLQIKYIGLDPEEMGEYSIIKNEMVFYPPNYEECIKHIFKRYSKYSIDEIRDKHKTTLSFFVPFNDHTDCLVYIRNYSGFISEVAHMALMLLSYYLKIPCNRMVSELYDGTMTLIFGLHLDKIKRDEQIYSCLPEEIKDIARNLVNLNPLISDVEYIYEQTLMNKLEALPNYMLNIEKCFSKNRINVLNFKQEEIRNYVHNEIVLCHIQASYILMKYKENFGIDDYYRRFWNEIFKLNKLNYKDVGKLLRQKFNIVL